MVNLEREPIAIIGMGCRFPSVNTIDDLWSLLENNKSIINDIPLERWDIEKYYSEGVPVPGKMNTRLVGFLTGLKEFDYSFFNIKKEEAMNMDPQQKIILEVTWEALENAAISLEDIEQKDIGVFIGASNYDYGRLMTKNPEWINMHSATGSIQCIVANRLSYFLNVCGPSYTVDTACASSSYAIHQACQSLLLQESEMAIAGGVNIILSPEVCVGFSQANLLSPSGKCKSFDENADGYVRSEGCGIIILKRLSDALKNNDRIFALIKGTATNHNGTSNSLPSPSPIAIENLMRKTLKLSNIKPSEVSYVEAHGASNKIADAIEMGAIKKVYGDLKDNNKCAVSCVKTNLGYCETTSGIAALFKIVLSMKKGKIPAHLNLSILNKYIDLEESGIFIPTENIEWNESKKIAAVNSYGIGGANAHLIIEDYNTVVENKAAITKQIFILSAKTEKGYLSYAKKYIEYLTLTKELNLSDICYTLSVGRSSFKYGNGKVVESISDIIQFLKNAKYHEKLKRIRKRKSPRIAFYYKVSAPFLFSNVNYLNSAVKPQHYSLILNDKDSIMPALIDFSLLNNGFEHKVTSPKDFQLILNKIDESDETKESSTIPIQLILIAPDFKVLDKLQGKKYKLNVFDSLDEFIQSPLFLKLDGILCPDNKKISDMSICYEFGNNGVKRLLLSLWKKGHTIYWKPLYAEASSKIDLPTHPFLREKCWIDTNI